MKKAQNRHKLGTKKHAVPFFACAYYFVFGTELAQTGMTKFCA
jgi:hypothetical protein